MNRAFSLLIITFLVIALIPTAFAAGKRARLKVTSPAFKHNHPIPAKYAMAPDVPGGENCSIPLKWEAPKEVKGKIRSYAISIVDPHPVANNWVHWLAVDIPGTERELKECASGRAMPHEAWEFKNSYGELGYGGPAAPPGTGIHPYHITIYGLNTRSLNPSKREMSFKQFQKLIKGKTVAQGKIIGTFEQK